MSWVVFIVVAFLVGWFSGENFARYTLPKWKEKQERLEKEFYEELKKKYEK